MKSADELLVMAVFALIGGVTGFLVFVLGLGGWEVGSTCSLRSVLKARSVTA